MAVPPARAAKTDEDKPDQGMWRTAEPGTEPRRNPKVSAHVTTGKATGRAESRSPWLPGTPGRTDRAFASEG